MSDIKIICQNKRARHEYFIEDSIECGLMLRGPEVKSLRDGKANLTDSYASVERNEVWLINFHINPYSPAQQYNLNPTRQRKLLLNRREIDKLIGRAQDKGYTLVPLKVYFKNGIAKVELAICKAKKLHDKRATLKKREATREIEQAMKKGRG